MIKSFDQPHSLSPEASFALKTFLADLESEHVSTQEKAERGDALRLLITILDVLIELADGATSMNHLTDCWLSIHAADEADLEWEERYGWPATLERARRNCCMSAEQFEAILPDEFWAEHCRDERHLDILHEQRAANRRLFDQIECWFRNMVPPCWTNGKSSRCPSPQSQGPLGPMSLN